MAEIIFASGRRRLSTRVDLTPMVDLGFLLITFFIFTTTMNEPTGMKVVTPTDGKPPNETAASKTLNILLGSGEKIIYYQGDSLHQYHSTHSIEGIRSVIRDMRKKVKEQFQSAEETVVLIKPGDDCAYKNVVDLLDEMTINGITRYTLMDPGTDESLLLNQ